MKALTGPIACVVVTALLSAVNLTSEAQTAKNWRQGAGLLKLLAPLDRPEDGYCLDVAGSGDWVDFSMPLNAHNCKPGLYADEAVVFDKSPGKIRFPAYKGCVTAVGLNGRSLPGATVMLKPCADAIDASRAPFVDEALQVFKYRQNGQLELGSSGLCLGVGAVSDRTFSATHRWRPMLLMGCQSADLSLSRWMRFEPFSK